MMNEYNYREFNTGGNCDWDLKECRYCGQILQTPVNSVADDVCSCSNAVHARNARLRRQRRIDQAVNDIHECFSADLADGECKIKEIAVPEKTAIEMVALLSSAVESVVDRVIIKIEISGHGTKGTLSYGSKGKISVKRTDTLVTVRESEE